MNANGDNQDEGPMTYEKASKIRMTTQYTGAVMLIVVSIMKLISIDSGAPSLRNFIMCFYLIAIATIMVAVEYGHAASQ